MASKKWSVPASVLLGDAGSSSFSGCSHLVGLSSAHALECCTQMVYMTLQLVQSVLDAARMWRQLCDST